MDAAPSALIDRCIMGTKVRGGGVADFQIAVRWNVSKKKRLAAVISHRRRRLRLLRYNIVSEQHAQQKGKKFTAAFQSKVTFLNWWLATRKRNEKWDLRVIDIYRQRARERKKIGWAFIL